MLLAELEGFVTEPSTAVKETGRCYDPMTKSSVLSPLSLSLFKDIHVAISCKHASILGTITDELESNEK